MLFNTVVYLKGLWVKGEKFKGIFDAPCQELEMFVARVEHPAVSSLGTAQGTQKVCAASHGETSPAVCTVLPTSTRVENWFSPWVHMTLSLSLSFLA